RTTRPTGVDRARHRRRGGSRAVRRAGRHRAARRATRARDRRARRSSRAARRPVGGRARGACAPRPGRVGTPAVGVERPGPAVAWERRVPESTEPGKSLPVPLQELWQLVVAYFKQETVEPVNALGRFVGFGVAGSLMLGVGIVLIVLGGLRA